VIRIAGSNVTCRVSPQGTKLRSLLMGLALLPYNGLANAVNCRGLGTCGTCAVRLDPASSAAEGVSVSPMGARERLRLSLPPHRKEDLVTEQGSMRLACQCRVLPNANLTLSKQRGFWGQRADTCTAEDEGVIHGDVSAPQFDFELIRHLKPFPLWLQQEMRSNHAGETGAVMIYTGALWALKIRRSLGLEFGPDGYEAKVHEFSAEHQETEREHLVLLNHVLDETEALDSGGGVMPAPRNPAHSVLLPAWKGAGFALGALSTLWCPRGLYVTTEAVEAFVEEHYQVQIGRLQVEADSIRKQQQQQQEHAGAEIRDASSMDELRRMLAHCCEDEVHHKEEAAARAAKGPQPWFKEVDIVWQWMVSKGSDVAAQLARRG
jgi:ubiquinone biosynthesis monooxygenase Coq7